MPKPLDRPMRAAIKTRRGRKAGVVVLARTALELMTIRELLGRLERLRRCEEDATVSDMTPSEVAMSELILFKSDVAWRLAYSEVKELLSTREHVAGGVEHRATRVARAQRNRRLERRPKRRSVPRQPGS
jgi:hypothetical protein